MSGPPPTPTILKVLRNNPGKRRLNDREPHPDALSLKTPRELTDDVARREWRNRIVPAIRIGQITSADKILAIAHCELFAVWQSQIATAAKHPHVVAVGAGHHPMPNPARIMSNKTLQLLVKIDAELGLSPASRSRVHVNESLTGSSNPLDRYLRKVHA